MSDHSITNGITGMTGMERGLKCIDQVRMMASRGYYAWFIVYVGLAVTSIVLPAMAAFLSESMAVRILAGMGALFGALMGIFRPHEYAFAYDNSFQRVSKTRVAFELGAIDNIVAAKELRDAIDAAMSRPGQAVRSESNAVTSFVKR